MSTPNLITADRCPSCGGFNTNRGKTQLWCNDCQRHTWQYGKYGEYESNKEVTKEQPTSSPLPPVISDAHGEQECSVSDCPCHEWVRRFGGRVSGRECNYPPSLIDAAKKVEQWWLQLDKNKHGFYGAPECVFSLRAAIEECDRERQPAARGGGDEGKRYLLAERVRFHRLFVAVKAMRTRHREIAKKSNFGDCGCDDCLLLQPILTAIEHYEQRSTSE